jgi:hypothetical protein
VTAAVDVQLLHTPTAAATIVSYNSKAVADMLISAAAMLTQMR